MTKSIIETSGAAVTGHFVYKARYKHGPGYIDKEGFPEIGASNLTGAIFEVAENAMEMGFNPSHMHWHPPEGYRGDGF